MKRLLPWLGLGALFALQAHEIKTIAQIRHDNWKLRRNIKKLYEEHNHEGLEDEKDH